MSLADAVLEIADQMEADVEHVADQTTRGVLRGYVRQLRSAVKASNIPLMEADSTAMKWVPDNTIREALQKQAQEQLINAATRTRAEEAVGNQGVIITLLHGGPFDGDTVPVSPDMPVGAKAPISGAVYELKEGGELHYSEEATKKYQEMAAARG